MLRPLSFRETQRRLLAAGFLRHSQKGSHVKYVKETSQERRTVIVPHHAEVAVGTLRSICRQAGLTPEEFMEL